MSVVSDSMKRISRFIRNIILEILRFRMVLEGKDLQSISTRLLLSSETTFTDTVRQSLINSSSKKKGNGGSELALGDNYRSYISHQTMASGWYMLEVSVNVNLIGSDFVLHECIISTSKAHKAEVSAVADLSVRNSWNILLGSHSLTKRLIYLPEPIQQENELNVSSLIAFSIQGNIYVDDFPLVVISRVTQEFALSRMKKKLNYASGFATSEIIEQSVEAGDKGIGGLSSSVALRKSSLSQIYARYDSLFKRHILEPEYNLWLQNRTQIAEPDSAVELLENQGLEVSKEIHLSIVLTAKQCSLLQLKSLIQAISKVADCEYIQIALFATTESIQLLKCIPEFSRCKQLMIHALEEDLVSASFEIIKDAGFKCVRSGGKQNFHMLIGGSVILNEKSILQFVRCIKHNPLIKIVYSDHDMIDSAGLRSDPVFKPEWNPELLLNCNYIGNCFLIESSKLQYSASWNAGLELAAFYQCLLLCGFSCDDQEIYRISKILWHRDAEAANWNCTNSQVEKNEEAYHFGSNEDKSVLQNVLAITEAEFSNSNLIQELHKDRCGSATVIPGKIHGSFRIQRPLSVPVPSVEIIIPTRDRVDILKLCISSLLDITEYSNYRITIVDNESIENDTLSYFEHITKNVLVNVLPAMGEFNYSKINNIAVQQSTADIVLLLNNDTEIIHTDWLSEMVSHASRPDIGCVGAKLIYSNNRIQHAGVLVGLKGMAGHAHRFADRMDDGYCGRLKFSQNVSAVTAACLAVRRSVYNEVQGLDEVNLKVAYNDVDFCLRVRELGYRNLWTPYAELYHHESVSRGSDDSPAKQKRFRQEYAYMRDRWNTDTFVDPAYNPNLSKDLENFSLAA